LNNNQPINALIRHHFLSLLVLVFASGLFLTCFNAQAAPYVVESSSTSFGGKIIPQTGACEMAYDTSILTNTAGNVCTTGLRGNRGHFKVFATPNTTVRIVVRPHNDSGDGVVFFPSGVIFSDSSAPIDFVESATTNIDSGASGIVEIYVGGVLTLVSKPNTSTTYNFTNEIDFSENP
jgi:hypothetical protein